MTGTHETSAVTTRPQTTPEATGRVYAPRVDVVETDDDLILYADLPGVKVEDVSLRFNDGELVLDAPCPPRHAGKRAVYAEYAVGSFHREFRVNEQVEPDRIEAAMMDGVLAIRLPKADAVKPRRIPVRGS